MGSKPSKNSAHQAETAQEEMDPSVQLFFRQFHQAQMAGAIPMCLQFDKSEFSRKVEQEVEDVIKTTEPYKISSGSRTSQIAAQFKHSNLKSSALSVPEIEVILTRIVKERRYEGPEWPVVISYSDTSFLYGKGVREFSFQGKN